MTFRILKVLLVTACLALTTRSAFAGATAKLVDNRIVMENNLVRLEIDPQVGGRVSQFVFKPWDNTNMVYPTASNGGIALDMFWQQSWPGEMLKNPYQYKIINAGPKEAVVQVWRVSTGISKSKMVKDVAGIRIERTFTLRDGDRALHLDIKLINTADTTRVPGYWIQNNFNLPGGKDDTTWYRPTARGIDTISVNKPSANGYWYFVNDPTAGWLGVADKKLDGGVMMLMDYNELWKLYTNMASVTSEWFYNRVAIPPGKSWDTAVDYIPTPGLSSYVFGAQPLVAEMDINPIPGKLTVTQKFTSGTTGMKNVTVHTWAQDARGDWKTKPIEQEIAQIDTKVATLVTEFPDAKSAPLVVHVEVSGTTDEGKAVTFKYGDYAGGTTGRNNDLITLAPLYTFDSPEKVPQFIKPDKIVKKKNDHLRVLFVRGLWHQYSGVDEAIKQIPGTEVTSAWYSQSDTGTSLLGFPYDYNTLLGYDVVVLANVNGQSLGGIGQEMLADFVKAGGGVLMVGGDRTFGEAGFSNKDFTDLLPVTIKTGADWKKLDKPTSFTSGDGPLAKAVKFNSQTVTMYQQFQQPAAGAKVALSAGGAPVIVTKVDGKGKVAASLVVPFGDAPKGKTAYWNSPQWYEEMRDVLQWLSTP